MEQLQLKVKHFVKVQGDKIVQTKYVDNECGCVIEQATVDHFNIGLDDVDEAVESIYIKGRYIKHDKYLSLDFFKDMDIALQNKDNPEFVIRTLTLNNHEE